MNVQHWDLRLDFCATSLPKYTHDVGGAYTITVWKSNADPSDCECVMAHGCGTAELSLSCHLQLTGAEERPGNKRI